MSSAENTICVVQARTGSSRLPGKVLAEVGGRPMLRYQLDRLATLPIRVVVATSSLDRDQPVVDVAAHAGVEVVRGPEQDVLGRYLAVLETYPARTVVRLTGDCPLVDPDIVMAALALHADRAADYTCNVLPRSYPKGLDVEVVSAGTLRIAAREATDPAEREHVTPFVYRRPERFRLTNLLGPADLGAERWVVDTADDLEFVRHVVGVLGDRRFGWQDVLAAVGRRQVPAPGELVLRPARSTDSSALLAWRNDPDTTRFSRSGRPVAHEDHEAWLDSRLRDAGTRIWIGDVDGEAVGFVRVDVRDGVGEVSIAVDPNRRGSGVGRSLLAALDRMLDEDVQIRRRTAVVSVANLASQALFRRAGYVEVGSDGDWTMFEWAQGV